MDAFFTQLGRTIHERWKQENFSLPKFSEIAGTALEENPPAQQVDLPAFIRAFLLEEEQPAQTDSGFGQPELVVYSDSRFYIQLLFWLDGTTAIHQHEFSGAFHVLAGSSIHAQFAFENARPVTPYFRMGDVRMEHIELLETGRTVSIASGPRSIHSLFHLDTPSITVVVRTQHDPGTGPQFNYLPPHVALDPVYSDPLTLRRQQLLDVLEQTEDPTYPQLVREMIDDLDFSRGFLILRYCLGPLRALGEWEAIFAAFQKKHGSLAEGVEATLDEEERRELIKGLRSRIGDPEHRFFLALMMNAATRADILAIVAARYPEAAPMETVLRWAEELMEISDETMSLLDASFPETELAPDGQVELFLAALRHFMVGGNKTPAILRDLPAAQLKQLRENLMLSSLRVLIL